MPTQKRAKKHPRPLKNVLLGASIKGYLTNYGYNAIHYLHSTHLPIREIARRLRVAPATVRYNLRRLPPGSVPRKSWRDKKIINARRAAVRKAVSKKNSASVPVHNSVRRIAKAVTLALGRHTARGTVHNDLRALGYCCRVRPLTPIGTPNEAHTRVVWCRRHQKLAPENIIFSDEKLWDCKLAERTAWVRRGTRPQPRVRKQWSAKCHVWACVGVGVKLLVFLNDGKITSDSYVETLETKFLRSFKRWKKKNTNFCFMQDNAPAHRAKNTLQWLEDHGVSVLSWPPYSPDLNPLENIWAMMVQLVARENPKTRDELIQCIQRAWDSISQDVVDRLVLGFTDRVKTCIDNEGQKVQ